MMEVKHSFGLIKPIEKRKIRKMKSFSIPTLFKSNLISRIKEARRVQDKMKKDFKPAILGFNLKAFRFLLWRRKCGGNGLSNHR